MSTLLSSILTLASCVAFSPDRTELKATGGSVRFDYGAAGWSDGYEELITDGFVWRLSGGSPNRLDVKGIALRIDDSVLFPGSYNVAAICRGEPHWEFVFHTNGLNYEAGPHHGITPFELSQLNEEERTSKLQITLGEQQGTPQFDIRFGPRRLTKSFQTVPTKTAQGRAGKFAFTSTYLLWPDTDEVARLLDEEQLTVARVESKFLDAPITIHLRDGGFVEAAVESDDPIKATLFLEGTSEKQEGRPISPLEQTLARNKDHAKMTFAIANVHYSFNLPETLFSKR